MKNSAAVTIPSDPKFLCVVRDFTAGMARLAGMDEKTSRDIKLAVDEACGNVIKHAYGGATDKEVTVRYKKTEKIFEVLIEDEGVKARRGALKGRDLDDLREGGLGMHFIQRAFDVCALDERKKKGNRLRLIKYLGAGDAD